MSNSNKPTLGPKPKSKPKSNDVVSSPSSTNFTGYHRGDRYENVVFAGMCDSQDHLGTLGPS
jgi:hypothetical protein